MDRLKALYSSLLAAGFLVLRQAIDAKDIEWAAREIELLHNLPSLLDEPNVERHRYFWFSEREHYLEWVNLPGREKAKSRMQTFYAPVWNEMQPYFDKLDSAPDAQGDAHAHQRLVDASQI